ncbi:MAG: hypothetical protein LBH97_07515 [Treponema sp.]|jgi:hypothetical protein|nr:hypothetical protein [Treponema sp.]
MKRYCIKCQAGRAEYIEILRETQEGYVIRLVRQSGGSERIIQEEMTRELFDMCLKTGHIYEMTEAVNSVA